MIAGRSVYFDLESAGLELLSHPVIQLAAIAVDDATWDEVGTFEAKIAFDPSLADPAALALNHWTPEAWANAKPVSWVVREFGLFLKRHATLTMISKRTGAAYSVSKLCGHNAASFDGPRLQLLFQREKAFLPADPRIRDTMQRALFWFDERGEKPVDYKLSTLCQHFGIETDGAHEALTDVRLTIALAKAMRSAAASKAA